MVAAGFGLDEDDCFVVVLAPHAMVETSGFVVVVVYELEGGGVCVRVEVIGEATTLYVGPDCTVAASENVVTGIGRNAGV